MAKILSRSPYTRLVDVQLNEAMRTVSGTLRPTPLPWLPVLSHIAPPHLRRKEATTTLLAKIRRNDSLPLRADIENHPPARLPSRHPVTSMVGCSSEELSTVDEWLGTDVIHQSLVDDPTAFPPGFNLPRHLSANLNSFRTGQEKCAANLARWRKIPDPSCSCGAAKQTMSHIVNDCPLSRFPNGLTTLHLAGDEAIKWLGMQCKR